MHNATSLVAPKWALFANTVTYIYIHAWETHLPLLYDLALTDGFDVLIPFSLSGIKEVMIIN